jgi:hypothetical protein
LFVGPFTDEDEKIMEIFKKIAMNCRGNVWVVLIPHPGEWDKKYKNCEIVNINLIS